MHGHVAKSVDPAPAGGIDLRNLRYFVAVAEAQSFRQGAAALGVRQPTVSRQVRDLEDALGIDLFERHPGEGVRLTPAGRTFLARALRVLADLDRACTEAGCAGRAETGTLAIAFSTSLAGGRLHDLLSTFRRERPEVSIRLLEGNTTDQLLALKDRGCDVAFLAGTFEAPGADHETLWIERAHVALPMYHPLAAQVFVAWGEIKGETFLVRAHDSGPGKDRWLAARLAPSGLPPRILQHAVSRENLIGLVAAGFGLTVVPASATGIAHPGVVFRPIRDDSATIAVTAAWLPENPNPALRRFLCLARDLARAAQSQVPSPGTAPAPEATEPAAETAG